MEADGDVGTGPDGRRQGPAAGNWSETWPEYNFLLCRLALLSPAQSNLSASG